MPRRLSIAARFFLLASVVTGAALAFSGFAGYLEFRRAAGHEADRQLLRQARLLAEIFRPHMEAPVPDRARIAAEGDRLGRSLDVRLTVVLPDGEVVADSVVGAAGLPAMENHADRPEIQAALAGREGVAQRRSITKRDEERYAAVAIVSGGRTLGVARASLGASRADRHLAEFRSITLGTGAAAFLLLLMGAAARARRIRVPLDEMRAAANDLSAGNWSRRVNVRTGDELEDMAGALNHMASHLERTIRQLDTEKARLATLLENLSEGVIVIAPDRVVRMFNRKAAALLGVAGPSAEGRPCTDVIRHPGMLACVDALLDGREAPPETDVELPSKAGTRTIRLSNARVRYREEKGTDLLLTLRDVTEERRLARVKSEFVSNASHELRTPLTNIRGYLEAVSDSVREGHPVDPAFVDVALSNALRMERLVTDLLELSRAEAGILLPNVEEATLSGFLARVAEGLEREAGRLGKTVSVEAEEETIRADLRSLSAAVTNLVENGIRYGKEGGRVRVRGRIDGDRCVIEVADDGPGIAPEHLPRLFERFYRVEKGRSRELGGTGLGLSIARHVVESHGGTIGVESRPGAGTTFTIRIPREPDPRRPRAFPRT